MSASSTNHNEADLKQKRSRALYVLKTIGVASLYFAIALVALSFAFRQTNVSPVWPPTGVALAALLLLGSSYWPAIFIGAFSANFLTLSFPVSVSIAAGNTLEAVCAAYLIRRLTGTNVPLYRAEDVGKFILAAVLSSTVSATFGTTSIYIAGFSAGATYWYLWWTWWLGDAVGAVVFGPLILSWFKEGLRLRHDRLKVFLLLIAFLVIGYLVFGPLSIGNQFVYLTVPLVILAVFAFRNRGATASIMLLSVIAVWGTKNGYGPFVSADLNESLLILQFFIGTTAATALILSAVLTERLQLLQSERAARKKAEVALNEKNVLMQEIHHRVKNNMQVISSLLNLQGRSLKDPEMVKSFQESSNRIRAMALIHEKLYRTQDFSQIRFADYLQTLARDLLAAFQIGEQKISVQIAADEILLDINKAVPLGLITNELITNSIKHAFPGDRHGVIDIRMEKRNSCDVFLKISDNGIGLPAEVSFHDPPTLGLKLVNILVTQIEGSLEVDRSASGAACSILFSISENP